MSVLILNAGREKANALWRIVKSTAFHHQSVNYKPEDFAERRIQSMPRNRKILDILYRSKNVEVQGSGIRKVLELCAKNNVKYEYYNNEFGFRFSFHRNNVTSDVTTETPKRVNELDFEVLHLLNKGFPIRLTFQPQP